MKYEGEIRSLIWLVSVLGIGNRRVWDLLLRYQTPQNAEKALRSSEEQRMCHLSEHSMRRIGQIRPAHIDAILERCMAQHQSILWYGDPEYPSLLHAIENPPVLLFYQGQLDLLQNDNLLTVVGTRNPTEYSPRIEKTICQDLIRRGFIFVTGFAVGVDIAANLCALEHGRPSVALMGCGLDQAYPRPNVSLKARIAANGLLLSEFLPGVEPHSSNFPIRNRILSGLTMGTFVVQAPSRSGALVTAEYAIEQGRDLFCLPPADIFDKRYMGVIKYLRDGAIPVFDSSDIFYEYDVRDMHGSWMMNIATNGMSPFFKNQSVLRRHDLSSETNPSGHQPAPVQEAASVPVKTMGSQIQRTALSETAQPPHSELQFSEPIAKDSVSDDPGQQIIAMLRRMQVMHIDDIAAEIELPMETLLNTLIELELFGKIERIPGKQYRII